MEYDPVKWIMKFSLNNEISSVDMPIIPAPVGDNYYPAVSLTNIYDTVEIIPKKGLFA